MAPSRAFALEVGQRRHTMPRMRRGLLTLVCAVLAALPFAGRASAQVDRAAAVAAPLAIEPARGPVLLELFTSQGCSACPPADRLLASLAPRDDLLVLSFHVSYWDHMGWADPFAIPASARRQRGYARTMRSRSVYTPQMVVQGGVAAVGSDETRIMRLIADAAPTALLGISREMGAVERFQVEVPELKDVSVALELWAVMYGSADGRFVPHGENAGHMLQHVNVVRQAGIVAVVERTPALVQFDRPDIAGADGVALILQARNLGPVVGTGRLSLR
jgi:hypothetical protein